MKLICLLFALVISLSSLARAETIEQTGTILSLGGDEAIRESGVLIQLKLPFDDQGFTGPGQGCVTNADMKVNAWFLSERSRIWAAAQLILTPGASLTVMGQKCAVADLYHRVESLEGK